MTATTPSRAWTLVRVLAWLSTGVFIACGALIIFDTIPGSDWLLRTTVGSFAVMFSSVTALVAHQTDDDDDD